MNDIPNCTLYLIFNIDMNMKKNLHEAPNLKHFLDMKEQYGSTYKSQHNRVVILAFNFGVVISI